MHTERPEQHRLTRFTALALSAVALFRIATFFRALPIAAPFQFDYEEGNILNALSRIVHGATPYPDPHALPNIINPYGPAAYYLLAVPAKIFGLAFLYPRAMILACAIAIAISIALELRRATGSLALAATFGLVFLTVPVVQQWMWLLRVDLLAVAFTAGGLVVFSRALERSPEHRRTAVAALLFALGLLIKPTVLAAPAACFFALLLRRRFRAAARLTAVTLAIFAAVMATFALATRGALLTDFFFSHPDPFSFRVFTEALTSVLVASWPLALLAVLAIANDFTDHRYSPAVLWFLLATATAVTAGKLGSNTNHLLEWEAALCLVAGLGFWRLMRLPPRAAITAAVIAVAALAFVIVTHTAIPMNRAADAHCPEAYKFVRTQTGPVVLSENVGALVLGGKEVWVSNPFVLAQLVEHAGWSDADLVRMVHERRFDAIFTSFDYASNPAIRSAGAERFSPAVLRAIADNYVAQPGFVCLDMNVVYRPKSPPAIQSVQVPGR